MARRLTGRRVAIGSIAAACVVAGAFSWLRGGVTEARPGLELESSRRDFGVVTPTEKLPVAFTLRNAGTETLRISGLDSTCGCAKPKLDREVISPGEAATIEVAFSAPERSGVFDHAVFFQTNDPDRRTVVLRLTGQALWPIEAVPTNLYLGIVRAGETASAEATG